MQQDEDFLLRRQLLGWVLIPLLLLLTADAFVGYWIALRFAQGANDRALGEIARDVSLHVRTANGQLRLDMPATARQLLFSDPTDRIVFQVTGSDGGTIEGVAISAPPGEVQSATTSESFYDGQMEGIPVRIVQLKVGADSVSGRPPVQIRIAETKHKRNELAREILISVVAPQILLILIAAALVWAGVKRGLAPLESVRRTVASRSGRDWRPLTVSAVPGEVRPLLRTINELISSLDAALTMQQRFIADAAHQLKTPMAALSAQLELALRESDAGKMRLALQELHGGLSRMSRVISQILSLARNEPEAVRETAFSTINLRNLAFDTAAQWVQEALRAGIDLGFEGESDEAFVRGNAGRLREMLDNLIDNAIRYSRKGGRVTVRVASRPVPAVAIADNSPVIPAEHRNRIFDRFHRLLGNATAGSGLGLAIVREIAKIHSASIDLQKDDEGTGNVFTVSFPPAPAPEHATRM